MDRTTAESLPAAGNKSLNTDNISGEAVSPVLSAPHGVLVCAALRAASGRGLEVRDSAADEIQPDSQFCQVTSAPAHRPVDSLTRNGGVANRAIRGAHARAIEQSRDCANVRAAD